MKNSGHHGVIKRLTERFPNVRTRENLPKTLLKLTRPPWVAFLDPVYSNTKDIRPSG